MIAPPVPPKRTRWIALAGALALALVIAFAMFASRVGTLRAGHATGPNWSFPSRVYSAEVTLEAGRILPAEYLLAELVAREYREVDGAATEAGTYSQDGDAFEIALRAFPEPVEPSKACERVRLRLRNGRLVSVERLGEGAGAEDARHGTVRTSRDSPPGALAPPRLEPVLIATLFDDDRTWRTWTPIERVPLAVVEAVVASEDRRFRRHLGIDPRGFGRALLANARAGAVREGGSTITQQLARSLFLGRERTLGRKLAEVPLALGLELALGKRRILEMYLNAIYWGQAGSTGIGGIAAASQWYFDRPVESLGALEGATLAAMIPAPNVFDPFQRPDRVLARRNRVLADMVETRALRPAEAAELSRRPLEIRRGAVPVDRAPSYTGFVRQQLEARLPAETVSGHGLTIETGMDLVWQRQAEDGLADAVTALDGGGRGKPPLEGAFVAIEPGTGTIRALVGGRDPAVGAFNRATRARRQTGSAIKPIVYAAAFASGRALTPASPIADEPRTFQTDLGPWTPHNDDWTHHGTVTLVKALQSSLNVATTNLVDLVGPREVARVAARFGLGALKPVMSIGLGSNESTLLDLTGAFAVFGDGGVRHPPSTLVRVTDRSGALVPEAGAAGVPAPHDVPVRVVPARVAALMTGLLTDVVRFGIAYPLRKDYGFMRPVAGKTGTTNDYRDAWFIGFTPDIVAGVWIGYDRPRSLGRLAVATALPAWARVVTPMLEGFPPRSFASDSLLEWRDLEPWSGLLATRDCRGQPVPFLPGTAPRSYCQPGVHYGPEPQGRDSLAVADSVETESR